jgi:TRAP-type mannitol/chloroaromatic compound transport system substrate-binding protein
VTLSFLVNERAWNTLPKPFQAAFEVAAAEVNLMMLAQYDQRNPEAVERLVKQGVVFLPLPSSVLYAARDAASVFYEAESQANATFGALYAAWRTSLNQQNLWFKLAEGTYSSFVQQQRVKRIDVPAKDKPPAGKSTKPAPR